jgi:hypothetical protein
MHDLKIRFRRSLDSLGAPDLRPDIERRASEAKRGRPWTDQRQTRDTSHRVAAAVTAFAVFAAAGIFAWRAFDDDGVGSVRTAPAPVAVIELHVVSTNDPTAELSYGGSTEPAVTGTYSWGDSIRDVLLPLPFHPIVLPPGTVVTIEGHADALEAAIHDHVSLANVLPLQIREGELRLDVEPGRYFLGIGASYSGDTVPFYFAIDVRSSDSATTPPEWLVQEARDMAVANQDPSPTSAQWVLTNAQAAAPAVGLTSDQATEDAVYLVVLEGEFTGLAKGPSGADPPVGTTLVFTLDPATQQVLDWGITSDEIDVSGLVPFEFDDVGPEETDGTLVVPDPVEMAVDEAVIRHLVERMDWETIYVRETICENAATVNEPKGCDGEFTPEEQSLLSERLADIGSVIFVEGFEDLPSGLGGEERTAFVWLGPIEGHDGRYEVGGSMSCGPLCGTGSTWDVRDEGSGFKVIGPAQGAGIWMA